MYKKVTALILSLAMALSLVPQSFVIAAGEESPGAETAPVVLTASGQSDAGTETEPSDVSADIGTEVPESTHAYDPMQEIREQQAEEEFRENAEIVKKAVLFSVKETRDEGEKPSYLDDESLLCREHSLKDVELIFETRLDSGEYEMFYQASTASSDVWAVVDELNADERISNAEPDYVWETAAVSRYRVSDAEYNKSAQYPGLDVVSAWNELYSNSISAPGAGAVVAVIDTGVDYTHSDLAPNMWVNSGEIPGNKKDDDGNGYVDDVYGYNFVANNGDPMDDHGHGTHVAGIIGMSKGNGGGIGLAFGSKIMAIKAGQATGSFASTDIANAINYARANGADVINMSFGGTGKSYLVEAALRDASHDCVLVAAAGNDGLPTTDYPTDPKEDFYPAGYNYVLGVMATDNSGDFADFSNWDYIIGANCEYEMAAPGVSIYSTLPGNRYAYWSGTSMAAPAVSAAAAILRSRYTDKNQYTSRFIMGQLVSASDSSTLKVGDKGDAHTYPRLNIYDSLTNTPAPKVILNEFYMFDNYDSVNAPNNNGDGIAQPGEIIDIGFSVFNYWGVAKDVTVSIDTLSIAGIPSQYAEILTDSVNIGEVGYFTTSNNGFTYTDGALTGVSIPLRIKIKDNAPNDIQIPINFTVTAKNGLDNYDTTVYNAYGSNKPSYTITVQNGYALSGTIEEDMILDNKKYWIIQNNLRIPEGVTVTVEPGTQIQFWSADPANPYAATQDVYIQVEGRFIAEGTEDQPIEMFPGKGYENLAVCITGYESSTNALYANNVTVGIIDDDYTTSYSLLKYVNIINAKSKRTNTGKTFCVTEVDHCKFSYSSGFNKDGSHHLFIRFMSNSVFTDMIYPKYDASTLSILEINRCLFNNCRNIHINTNGSFSKNGKRGYYGRNINNNVFLQDSFTDNNEKWVYYRWTGNADDNPPTILNNAFLSFNQLSDPEYVRMIGADNGHETYDISGNYWGTTNPDLVKIQCYDADWNVSLDQLVQEPYLTLEDDMSEIYPFVTEAYLTDRYGNRIDTVNGTQQVSLHVKFNRDMAQDVQPMVTYGGIDPYTDYMPSGDWVGDREWRADFTISPDFEMGRMYIRVKGAVAADDRWLVTGEDCARFFFTVTNTGAQSMTLQGEGQLGQNSLSWVQDDYDTLAGYNVYRSTSYNSELAANAQGFKRINTSILSADELSYIDDSVEPSVPYYYYFTVIDTDMSESKPSNVIECTALESEPPVITHTPVTSCNFGENAVFTASITDNVSVESAALRYRYGPDGAWKTAAMQNTSGSNYKATVYVSEKADIEYYITATDGVNIGYSGSEPEPYEVSNFYMDRIEITQMPDKTVYSVGEEFDDTGLEVTAVYSDGTTVLLTADDYYIDFNGEETLAEQPAGVVTVTVEYDFEIAEFNIAVSENAEPLTATITFDTAGGSEIASITQECGTAVTPPDDPTRDGFVFAGWDQQIPETMPYEDVTITAIWEEIVDISTGTLIIDPIAFNYTGKQKTVSEITVTVNDTELDEDDYTVAGNTGTEPGIYTLTVTGKGRYQGTLSAQWKIARMYKVTATIGGVTTSTFFEEKTTALFASEGQGGWFIDGTLRSIRNELAFTVLGNSTVEWVEGDFGSSGVVNLALSERAVDPSTGYTYVEVTATWSIPDGAQLVEAGVARMYVEAGADIPDAETVFNNNKKQVSNLKTGNGTWKTYINMQPATAAKNLCTVAYLIYTVKGEQKIVMSEDVIVSAPE